MDVASRVTALAALHRDLQRDVAFLRLYLPVAEGGVGIDTAGAAYVELALTLAVEVQQVLAFQPSGFQIISAVHACLFIYREERLQRRMDSVFVCQDRHRRRYADTVVRTQRRTVGGHPFAVILDIRLDSVFLEIKHLVAVLLRHHIHVALQDHTRMTLHACRRRLADQHVTDLVL